MFGKITYSNLLEPTKLNLNLLKSGLLSISWFLNHTTTKLIFIILPHHLNFTSHNTTTITTPLLNPSTIINNRSQLFQPIALGLCTNETSTAHRLHNIHLQSLHPLHLFNTLKFYIFIRIIVNKSV